MLKLNNIFIVKILLAVSTCFAATSAMAIHAVCDNLGGSWSGKVNMYLAGSVCRYSTEAEVIAQDDSNFSADVSITKLSHNIFCPDYGSDTAKVFCNDDLVELRSEVIDMTGFLSADGDKARLNGYILTKEYGFVQSRMKLTKNN